MLWQSALALKMELTELIQTLQQGPRGREGDEGHLLSRRLHAQPAVALGIAPHPSIIGEHLVAVRTFDRRAATLALLSLIVDKGGSAQLEHRYLGRVSTARPVGPTPVIYRHPRFPLAAGYSVAHCNGTAGTIGAFVTRGEGSVHLLSAGSPLRGDGRNKSGDFILQPGPSDGGTLSKNAVAVLDLSSKLVTEGNTMDVAVARVKQTLDIDPSSAGTRLAGTRSELRGREKVSKLGRTTGRSTGRVTAVRMDGVWIDYSGRPNQYYFRFFDDLFEVQANAGQFSLGGDCGSMILDADGMALGLLLAGSLNRDVTYASPIEPILDFFEASLVR